MTSRPRPGAARLLAVLGLALLAACAPGPQGGSIATRAARPAAVSDLPPMKVFAQARPAPVTRSNSALARDFLDLSFALESGRALETFTRFEGPIRIAVTGRATQGMLRDLDLLITRIAEEAGIDIARTDDRARANIVIEGVTSGDIRRELPQAACFVVPNITRLSEFRRAGRSAASDWAQLTVRDRLAIFVPNDVSPQEMRDCLHEELAQAIGPLNDLYRLDDSVFNDDNMHAVLTGFDMLMLRVTYAPELRTGMSRAEVAARLPAILARINPRGSAGIDRRLTATPRPWIDAIQQALGPGAETRARGQAAARAVQIARNQGWRDHRMAFSLYIYARLTQARDPLRAYDHLISARRIYAADPRTTIHEAYVTAQLAAHEIARGAGARALALLDPMIPRAEAHENASLLSSLMMLRAEALDLTGRDTEARAVRLDSIGWARYGFGPDWAVRAKLREVAALNPAKGRS
ncbi:DUF2927 domain-containing protein [Pseudooceanicola aestuarii]|uniref:DUF2927 domain-containing protein n=1 Tax=Pseudooceanicola aestuarii TaxID=2697319 RepID=UPI0013CF45BC|nr:DUF2927 domain-containing protein [Pseudooceanicola aestuarii]